MRTSLLETARMHERARMLERGSMHESARMLERASMHERASVSEGESIHGRASMHGKARMHERASVRERARPVKPCETWLVGQSRRERGCIYDAPADENRERNVSVSYIASARVHEKERMVMLLGHACGGPAPCRACVVCARRATSYSVHDGGVCACEACTLLCFARQKAQRLARPSYNVVASMLLARFS